MDIKEIIFKVLSAKTNKKFNEDTEISTLDIDSMDLMEIVVDIEESLGISIPDEELTKLKTISDFFQIAQKILDSK